MHPNTSMLLLLSLPMRQHHHELVITVAVSFSEKIHHSFQDTQRMHDLLSTGGTRTPRQRYLPRDNGHVSVVDRTMFVL